MAYWSRCELIVDNVLKMILTRFSSGCSLTPSTNYTGQAVGILDCDGTMAGNPGCGITEWSRASYGPVFDSNGGGVFAMKWDETGISVCEFLRLLLLIVNY